MTELSIHLYSDKVYKQKNQLITTFDETLRENSMALSNLLERLNGNAISAPHAGINKRFFVINMPPVAELQSFYNPEIIEQGEMKMVDVECLSMPGVKMTVLRPIALKLQYQDGNGELKTLDAENELAHHIYHQMEVLNNKRLIDNLSKLKKERFIKKYEKWLAHEFSSHHHDEEEHVHGPNCQHD